MNPLTLDSQKLLQTIFGVRWKDAWVCWMPGNKFGKRVRDLVPGDLPGGDNCYFSIAMLKGDRRVVENVDYVAAVVIDDVGSKIDLDGFDMLAPAPTWWMETSKDNFQMGYAVNEPLTVDEYRALRGLMSTHKVWGASDAATDPVHLYRLPQGTNTKNGHKVQGKVTGGLADEGALHGLYGPEAPAGVTYSKKPYEWELSVDALRALVAILPNTDPDRNGTWITVLHGISGAGGDLEMWDEWSARHGSYDAAKTARAWDSLDHGSVKSGGGVLRKLAEALAPKEFSAWRLAWEAQRVFDDDGEVAVEEIVAAGGGAPNAKQLKYAQEVARRYGGVIRWNVDRGAWVVFGGGRWKMLEVGVKRAYQISVDMASVAGARGKGDADVMTAQFHNGVEDLCRQWAALQVRENEFDTDPWLLGTPEGTVDLKTGVLRPALASDMISKTAAVGPNSGGCPRWMRFIDEVTMGDRESKAFLQQYAGYCLTGVTKEEMFLFVHGPGKNGKSKFADTLMGVMGEYAVKPVGDLFVKKAHGMGHTSKLAMLAGARLCTISEVPASAQWDEVLLKDVTGGPGGKVTASFKHKNEFTFEPAFKLLAYGNHQPTFPGGIDESVRRRFWMMEFRFVPVPADTELMDKLRKEWPGILRWAIDGCLAWQRTGLLKPGAVEKATEGFFEAQDLVGRWLAERVEKAAGSKVQAADLFRDWVEWRNAEGNHVDFDNQTAFGLEMTKRRGLVKKPDRVASFYQDIKLKSKAATVFDEN